MRNHLLSPQLIADLASFYFSASGIPGGGIPPTDKEELGTMHSLVSDYCRRQELPFLTGICIQCTSADI
jgi:hypothetical protein